MRLNCPLLFILIVFICGSAVADTDLRTLARSAVSGTREEAEVAVRTLRSKKQAGLDALFEHYSKEIERFRKTGQAVENWDRISYALDQVAMQKDAYSSGLYWHKELSQAMEESRILDKPILSLRLLGDLDDEYSCANSRFFRSVLYTDPAIARTLREDYVLHWRSVRPAPKITIDFGDGRKLVRTVTGNSIHYVLDSNGRVIDALPGLYSPDKFRDYLRELRGFASGEKSSGDAAGAYRSRIANALIKDWKVRMKLLGRDPEKQVALGAVEPLSPGRVTALDAAPRAMTKAVIERPALLALLPQVERLRANTQAADWMPLSRLSGPIRISPESVALIRSKSGDISETEFASLIQNLKDYIAVDSVQNEFRFHTVILTWLGPENSLDVESFNKRVYSELFLTPDADKWLGLYSPDIYSAIENNGVVK